LFGGRWITREEYARNYHHHHHHHHHHNYDDRYYR
jgi:hypothetical protein